MSCSEARSHSTWTYTGNVKRNHFNLSLLVHATKLLFNSGQDYLSPCWSWWLGRLHWAVDSVRLPLWMDLWGLSHWKTFSILSLHWLHGHLLQGRIQGKSRPRLCSPPPVWLQGGWDTELWEEPDHLHYKIKTTVNWTAKNAWKRWELYFPSFVAEKINPRGIFFHNTFK